MNNTFSIPQVPEILTERFYTILSSVAIGTNRVQIDRKIENSFEVVNISGYVYLLTGAVEYEGGVTYYEIYPNLLKPITNGDKLLCVRYNTNTNQSVLSTAQNFDIYSKFFRMVTEFKEYTEKLNSVNISLPLNNYQLAVKNGFSGTESEWLESLKGKDGVTGSDQFVLKTLFDNTILTINQRLNALESKPDSGVALLKVDFIGTEQDVVLEWTESRYDLLGNNPEISAFYTDGDTKVLVHGYSEIRVYDNNDRLLEIRCNGLLEDGVLFIKGVIGSSVDIQGAVAEDLQNQINNLTTNKTTVISVVEFSASDVGKTIIWATDIDPDTGLTYFQKHGEFNKKIRIQGFIDTVDRPEYYTNTQKNIFIKKDFTAIILENDSSDAFFTITSTDDVDHNIPTMFSMTLNIADLPGGNTIKVNNEVWVTGIKYFTEGTVLPELVITVEGYDIDPYTVAAGIVMDIDKSLGFIATESTNLPNDFVETGYIETGYFE